MQVGIYLFRQLLQAIRIEIPVSLHAGGEAAGGIRINADRVDAEFHALHECRTCPTERIKYQVTTKCAESREDLSDQAVWVSEDDPVPFVNFAVEILLE